MLVSDCMWVVRKRKDSKRDASIPDLYDQADSGGFQGGVDSGSEAWT